MEIIIVDDNIQTNNETINKISSFIVEILNQLDTSHDCIDKIIFANENNYGNEIKKIDPSELHTDTTLLKGMGKTLYNPKKNTSIIIYISVVFNNLVYILNNNIKEECKEITLFLLLHEIGHCITNSKNKKVLKSAGDKKLSIPELNKYHFDIIIDEFSANRNIIMFIKKDWILSELEESHLPTLFILTKELVCSQRGKFIDNIWMLFKKIMDIGVFLIDYDISEYVLVFDELQLPFDIVLPTLNLDFLSQANKVC